MTTPFTYHSEHHADRQHRWIHFLMFAAAFVLILAGIYESFLYLTDWHAAEDDHSWFHLVLAGIYLTVGGLLAFAGMRHVRSGQHVGERFVTIKEGTLSYHLITTEPTQRITVAEITAVERRNVRDLVICLRDGTERILPIYLITNELKQAELVEALHPAIATAS